MHIKINNEEDYKITATVYYSEYDLKHFGITEKELKQDFENSYGKALDDYIKKKYSYLFYDPILDKEIKS